MERYQDLGQDAPTRMSPERQRARESLLADRAAVARGRAQRGVRLRPPASLPVLLGGRRRLALRTGLGQA